MQLNAYKHRDINKSSARRLLGSSLLCVVAAVGVGCMNGAPVNAPPLARANPNAKRKLGNFRPVNGTGYLVAPILSEGKSEYSSSSYESGNTHNHVFFNVAEESTLMLLPTNDQLLVATTSLPEKRESDKEFPTTQWFLYNIIKTDTDGDKEFTFKDRRSLAVSDAGGAGFKEVITDVEQMLGQTLHDANTLIIIYRKNMKNYSARVDLPGRQVVSEKEMPPFGVEAQ